MSVWRWARSCHAARFDVEFNNRLRVPIVPQCRKTRYAEKKVIKSSRSPSDLTGATTTGEVADAGMTRSAEVDAWTTEGHTAAIGSGHERTVVR